MWTWPGILRCKGEETHLQIKWIGSWIFSVRKYQKSTQKHPAGKAGALSLKEAQRPHSILSQTAAAQTFLLPHVFLTPTPRAEVRARLIELESFKIRISQRIKRLTRHAFYHHRYSAGSSTTQRKRSFPFDWSLQLWLLYWNKHFNYWYCALTRSSGGLLKNIVFMNIKPRFHPLIGKELTHTKDSRELEEKKTPCFLESYWVLLVLASRLYPKECLRNSGWCKVDFNAR